MITGAFAAARGIQADNKTGFAIANVAFELGEIGQFDLEWSDAATLSNVVGALDSSLVRAIAPTAGGIICGFQCIWLQTVSAGQRGRVLLWGEANAKIIKASGNVARMDRLVATTAKYLSPDHSAGDRCIAMAAEPLTAPSSATLAKVFFNGINGLSQFVS